MKPVLNSEISGNWPEFLIGVIDTILALRPFASAGNDDGEGAGPVSLRSSVREFALLMETFSWAPLVFLVLAVLDAGAEEGAT
jgi:hypothetical protein